MGCCSSLICESCCSPSFSRRLCCCYYCCCAESPKRNQVTPPPPPPPKLIVRHQSIQNVPLLLDAENQTDPPPPPPPSPLMIDTASSPIPTEIPVHDRSTPPISVRSDTTSNSVKPDALSMTSFTKMGLIDYDPTSIIQSYQCLPIGSLVDALTDVEDEIDLSMEEIRTIAEKFDSNEEEELTPDEAAAIYLVSMSSTSSISDILRKAWNANDPSAIEKWFKFLRLYHSALEKLDDVEIEAWQGKEADPSWKHEFSRKPTRLFTTTGLATTSKPAIKRYLKKSPHGEIMLMGYQNVFAKDISEYTEDDTFPQYALMPGIHIATITQDRKSKTGEMIYHLKGKDPGDDFVPLIIPTPITPRRTHFACPNSFCRRTCDGRHKDRFCRGFSYLRHTCTHHCGGGFRCYNSKCGKHQIYSSLMSYRCTT